MVVGDEAVPTCVNDPLEETAREYTLFGVAVETNI
jgi:hypothetical protein